MANETKEVTRVGNPGQNTAEITKERRPVAKDPKAKAARRALHEAAEKLKPYGRTHVGSGAFHCYIDSTASSIKPVYEIVCQTHVEECEEHLADFGWKQLRDALMEAFGRGLPKVRHPYESKS